MVLADNVAETPFDLAAHPQAAAYMRLIYYPTWTRLDGLLAGIAAATVMTFRPALWRSVTARPNLVLASGVLGIGAAILFFRGQIAGFFPTVLGYPLLSVSMAALVVGPGRAQAPSSGVTPYPAREHWPPRRTAGLLSHKMVYHAVVRLSALAATKPNQLLVAILAALIVGAGLYCLVERPFLRLRDRFGRPASLPGNEVLPMLPEYSVTDVSGRSRYDASAEAGA